jgi:hypothetical protein
MKGTEMSDFNICVDLICWLVSCSSQQTTVVLSQYQINNNNNNNITVLWNQGIQTDREVLTNRLDIIVKNKKDKMCLLIGVAIPSDKNVVQKDAEKKLKYKNLSMPIEIQRMWNMKCFVIPIITWVTGIVSKSLQHYMETIPGQHSIDPPPQKKKNCHTSFTTGSRGEVPRNKENL